MISKRKMRERRERRNVMRLFLQDVIRGICGGFHHILISFKHFANDVTVNVRKVNKSEREERVRSRVEVRDEGWGRDEKISSKIKNERQTGSPRHPHRHRSQQSHPIPLFSFFDFALRVLWTF